MPTKQQERAENAKRREELIADRKPVSSSVDINYPITSPAAKAQADRLKRDEEGAYSKPYPVESNLTATASAAEPTPQSPEEFKETGGVKLNEGAKEAEANASGTTEKADDTSKDDKSATKEKAATTAKK